MIGLESQVQTPEFYRNRSLRKRTSERPDSSPGRTILSQVIPISARKALTIGLKYCLDTKLFLRKKQPFLFRAKGIQWF